jgi:hypothetical protein
MKHFLKDMLPMALVMILATVFWLSGYYAGQNDERAFTLGCEPGLVSGPCVEDAQNALISQIASCTIEDAHAEKCFIPCSTDSDCLEKNGQTDH